MRKDSLSGLDLLEGPPWCAIPQEDMVVSVLHAAAPGLSEAREPCGLMPSVLLSDALVLSLGFSASGAMLI